ncbi:MAG: ferritin-like domain-containing protein [Solirubrobacterales bacterium]
MQAQTKLSDIDVDGAIQEAAHEAIDGLEPGDTRLDFFKKAGLTGGAVMGGGVLLSALTPAFASAAGRGRPPASFGKGDIGILNYALTLEYLEAAFYNEATANQAKTSFIKDGQTQVFLNTVTNDENMHVKALQKALGKKAVKSPKFNFQGDNAEEEKFRTSSFAFENEGVHAYSGQAFNIKDPAYLAVALSIVTIEARHAAVIGLIAKGSEQGIAPNGAFDTPYTAAKVLKDVTSLNYIQK